MNVTSCVGPVNVLAPLSSGSMIHMRDIFPQAARGYNVLAVLIAGCSAIPQHSTFWTYPSIRVKPTVIDLKAANYNT